jgi:sulfide dehydrogenase cytochrome subunit
MKISQLKKFRLLAPAIAALAAPSGLQAQAPAANRPSAETMAHACGGCHGPRGHALAPTPTLAGMSESEFVRFMGEFKSGARVSSIMNRIARGYADEDIVALAAFFNQRK